MLAKQGSNLDALGKICFQAYSGCLQNSVPHDISAPKDPSLVLASSKLPQFIKSDALCPCGRFEFVQFKSDSSIQYQLEKTAF